MARLVAFFGQFKTARGWALLIALVNLVGIAYGFYYYREQFAATQREWWLWMFVPDSPLAVLWAELALLAWWVRREVGVLDALAFIGNVQVGLWTVYVLLAYAVQFRTFETETWPLGFEGPTLNAVLLAAHAGMAVLALIFVQGMRERRAVDGRAMLVAIGVAAAYYLVNDVLDYFGPSHVHADCGMRPYTVPCDPAKEPALAAVTFGLTLFSAALLWWLTRPRAVAPS